MKETKFILGLLRNYRKKRKETLEVKKRMYDRGEGRKRVINFEVR